MEKGKTTRYFKYAIGEIILVVIGILIALQINNWNEIRKLKDTEANLLLELKKDLEETKIDLKSDIIKAKVILNISDSIYQKIINNKTNTPIKISISYISETSLLFPKMSAYEAIKSKGVNILSNDLLRKKITDFYQLKLPRIRHAENAAQDLNTNNLKPYLENNSKPSNSCDNCNSLFELYKNTEYIKKNNYIVYNTGDKLKHIIKNKFLIFSALIRRYEELEKSITVILLEINKELEITDDKIL